MSSPPPTSPINPLCGNSNPFESGICNIIAGCPITINTLYSLYSNFLKYLSTNKSLVTSSIIKILAYHYIPTFAIAFILLLGMWISGSIGFGGFLIGLVLITLVLVATITIAYFDYTASMNNIDSPANQKALNDLLLASYGESDKFNKFKCF